MRTLQNSLDFCYPFLGYQPLLVGQQEPAMTASNIVKQTMLGAPFAWQWNRSYFDFTCEATTTTDPILYAQDSTAVILDFGFIEKFWLTDTSGDVKEIPVQRSLSVTSNIARPASAAIQSDDTAGNITVRLNNLPDQAYKVTGQYQRRPAPMLTSASTWFPMPDHMSYIYDWGFLAIASLIVKDARFPIFTQKFTAHLLGAQDGLSELQRNLFLQNWLETMKMMERSNLSANQAVSGRIV